MELDNLKALIIEVGELDEQIKALQDKKAKMEAPLREAMSGVGKVIAGNFELSVTISKGRTTYDYKAMKADGIDLTPYEKTGAPYSTLKIARVMVIGHE